MGLLHGRLYVDQDDDFSKISFDQVEKGGEHAAKNEKSEKVVKLKGAA
jgi:hypothetical protein